MSNKRLIVVGGVASGTKAASKAKRENPRLEVIVLTRDKDISYAGCGLPYFMGGVIKERKELIVRTPQEFEEQQGIQVLTRREVTRIDCENNLVAYTELENGVCGVRLEDETLEAQCVIWAGGVRPNVNIAREAGIKLGPTGCIAVNQYQ